jgi:DNA-directed RNA polymerase specialized sigma24 family protein
MSAAGLEAEARWASIRGRSANLLGSAAMSSTGSVTLWLRRLQAGDHDAAQLLWERYVQRLVKLARARLRGAPRLAADEEDVALSAFDSFCRGAENGRFPRLNDRNDLWQLLVVLAGRKAFDIRRREGRAKRGGGRVRQERGASADDSTGEGHALDDIIGREPSPELAAQLAEDFRHRLDLLGDAELQSVALLKLEGHTIEEIAAKRGCVPRTVNRRIRLIRHIWEKEITDE